MSQGRAIPEACVTLPTAEAAVVHFTDSKVHRSEVSVLMKICTHVYPCQYQPDQNVELLQCLCQPRPFSRVTPVTVSQMSLSLALTSREAFGMYSLWLTSYTQDYVCVCLQEDCSLSRCCVEFRHRNMPQVVCVYFLFFGFFL